MGYYLDANGTDETDPAKVDRVYQDGTRIASNDTKAIAERKEIERAEELHRAELTAQVRKVTDSTKVSLPAEDVRDAVRAHRG